MECAITVPFKSEPSELCTVKLSRIVTAKIPHLYRCGEIINIGYDYLVDVIYLKDRITVSKTCEHCLSVRQVFFSSGWIYGQIWRDLAKFVTLSQGELASAQIIQLTPTAKGRVCDMIDTYFRQTNRDE